MSFTLELLADDTTEAARAAAEAAILAPLIAYNDSVAGPHGYWPLSIVVRDAAGAIAGGLHGGCFFDWCVIKLLVVPEAARGRGMGTQLLQQAEAVARQRGVAGIWLDTFSFQARGFYEKQGFTCFGTLEGHPRGGSRFFMEKRFSCDPTWLSARGTLASDPAKR